MSGFKLSIIGNAAILLTLGCTSHSEPAQGVEAEAYSILNEIIEDNNLGTGPLCEEPLPLDFIGEEWSSEFTPADIQFIEECRDSLKDRHFSTGGIVVWSPRNKDWKPVQVVPRSDSAFYDELSWPVFNEKRDLAVVHFASDTNGMLSGSGRTVLYIKLRGRWKRWKVYNNWIS